MNVLSHHCACVLVIICSFLHSANSYVPSLVDTNNLVANIAGFSHTVFAAYTPPALPLAPLVQPLPQDLVDYAVTVTDLLKQAALPSSSNDLIAIGVSESSAGFIGGITSRLVANIIGDRDKRDNTVLKGEITSVFFGVRGVTLSLALIAGIPAPIANILSGLAGSVIAESAKIYGRFSAEKADREGTEKSTRREKVWQSPAYQEAMYPLESKYRLTYLNSVSRVEVDTEGRAFDMWVDASARRRRKQGSLGTVLEKPRKIERRKRRVQGDVVYNNFGGDATTRGAVNLKEASMLSAEKPVITIPEAAQDMTKWVSYSMLQQSLSAGSGMVSPLVALQSGAISGLMGNAVLEILCRARARGETDRLKPGKRAFIVRYINAALEGAFLFAAYEGSLTVLDMNPVLDMFPALKEILSRPFF
jgi:hypothetical protein